MRRPALKTALGFCTGIILGYFTEIPLSLASFIFLVVCISYLILGVWKSKALNPLIFIIIGISGMFWYELRTTLFPENNIKNYFCKYMGQTFRFAKCNAEALPNDEKMRLVSRIIKDPDLRIDKTILECEVESVFVRASPLLVHTFEKSGFDKSNPYTARATTGKTRIVLKYPTKEFEYGDRIETYGRFYEPNFPRNPGSFDYQEWLKRRDISREMNIWEPSNIRIIGKDLGNPFVSGIALPMKRAIRRTIDEHLSWIQGAFLKGIVIGERGLLPDKIREYFQNTGVVHILAVSGLHVGIIAFITFIILSVFRVPLIPKQILTFIFLIIYAFMIDLRAPVVRAAIMSIFGMIALTTERDIDWLNVMSCAGLFILFLTPQALFDVSFQLSFGAVLSIIYLYPRIYNLLFGSIEACIESPKIITETRKDEITKKHISFNHNNLENSVFSIFRAFVIKKHFLDRLRSHLLIDIKNTVAKYFLEIFVVSLCVQIGLMPLIAYYFGKVTIISVIANVFVIPLTGVCITLTFIMSIFNLLPWEFLGNIFACANWGATTFTLTIIECFDKVPYGHFWVGRPSILLIVFSYLFILSGVNLWVSKSARKVFIYGVLLLANIFLWSGVYELSHPKLKVTYLDVGYGDCVFIEMPRGGATSGRSILIDGGPWKWGTWFDAGTHIVAPFLRTKGIKALDLVVATNPKIYRIGGLRYIIDNFKVKEFTGPYMAYSSKSWLRLLELLEYKDIPCSFVDTDNVGFVLEYGDISFLFPGIIFFPAE